MLCAFCRQESEDILCRRHSQQYLYDKENNWFRRKQRLPKGVRQSKKFQRYHSTEIKLGEILKLIFGDDKVFDSVHPRWAFNPDTGALLEYDYAIPHLRLFVEYNGLQHFEFPNFFHKNRAEFEAQKDRDELKRRFAVEHKWKLIIFDYMDIIKFGPIYEYIRKNV